MQGPGQESLRRRLQEAVLCQEGLCCGLQEAVLRKVEDRKQIGKRRGHTRTVWPFHKISEVLRDGLTELVQEDRLEVRQVVLLVEEQHTLLVLYFIYITQNQLLPVYCTWQTPSSYH
jgi:hypothetical protein